MSEVIKNPQVELDLQDDSHSKEKKYPESDKLRKEKYSCDFCQDTEAPCVECIRGQIFIKKNNMPRYPNAKAKD